MDCTAVLSTAIGGLIAVAAGVVSQLLAARAAEKADERALTRERDLRAFDAKVRRHQRRDEFQRDVLLELQDALQHTANLTGRAMFFDLTQARNAQRVQLPEELSEQILVSRINVNRLTERIIDENVRSAVAAFRETTAELSSLPISGKELTSSEIEIVASNVASKMNSAWVSVNSVLGESIRKHLYQSDAD